MDYNNQYDNNQMNNYTEPTQAVQPQTKGNAGWGVLGFFFPLIGLILFLVWKNNRPGDSKCAGVGALINVILKVVLVVIAVLFYGVAWKGVQNSLVDQTCKTYGETYKAVKKGDTWSCQDTVTGITIDVE